MLSLRPLRPARALQVLAAPYNFTLHNSGDASPGQGRQLGLRFRGWGKLNKWMLSPQPRLLAPGGCGALDSSLEAQLSALRRDQSQEMRMQSISWRHSRPGYRHCRCRFPSCGPWDGNPVLISPGLIRLCYDWEEISPSQFTTQFEINCRLDYHSALHPHLAL